MSVAEGDVVKISISDMEDLDMSIVEGEPWAQDMWNTLCQSSQKAFLNWCKIVIKLGLDKECIESWSNIFVKQVEETFCAMVADVNEINTRTVEKIEQMLCQLEKLCKELHQQLPSFGGQGLSLFQEQNQLAKKIEEYKSIVDARKAEIDELRTKQTSVCKSLGKEPKYTLEYPPLPTSAEVEKFQKYIDQLELEKFQREEKFFKLKEEVEEFVNELKYKPSSNFERLVLGNGNFLVTKSNMESLDLFHKHLKEQMKSTEEEISNLRSRIEDLWRMLEIDIMDQADFRNRHTGKSLDTLEAMRLEVKRCEDIRKKNIRLHSIGTTLLMGANRELSTEMRCIWESRLVFDWFTEARDCFLALSLTEIREGVSPSLNLKNKDPGDSFIEKLRRELEEVWNRCHCSESDKFSWYKSDIYTEDLLYFHEMEIQKWRSYFDKNAKLLGLIEKYTQLWERVIQLEENATGPNRYQNRGGKLLQEEKERNKLSKLIPKLEEEIRELACDFATSNNEPFKTRGLTIDEYISYLHNERENHKKLKLSARKLHRENTLLTPAKSAMSLFPSNSTAVTPSTIMSTTKRKILATPTTENKKPRMLGTTPASAVRQLRPASAVKSKTPIKIPQIKITSNTLSTLRQKREKRRSSERMRRIEKARRRSRRINGNPDEQTPGDTTNTTYSEFQIELSTNEKLRSTILPQEIMLTNPASSSPRKTPRAPKNTPKRTPMRYAPKSPGSNASKLSTCKSNLKLLF